MGSKTKDLKMISIVEIIKGLEDKTLNPKEFNKDVLREWAHAMKMRGYDNFEIGQLLQVTPRTVQRFISKARENHSLIASDDYQKHFMNQTVGNFMAQYDRLIRLSYSDKISDSERIRAIFAACQVQRDMVVILERLGYLNERHTIEAVRKTGKEETEETEITEAKNIAREIFPEDFDKLNSEQQIELGKHIINVDNASRKQVIEKKLSLNRYGVLAPEQEAKLEEFELQVQDAAYEQYCQKLDEFIAENEKRNKGVVLIPIAKSVVG